MELQKLDDGILELTKYGTILHRAAMIGDVDLTKTIMDKHPSLMTNMGKIEGTKGSGMIPAIAAACEGQLDILRMMIDYFKRKNDDLEEKMKTSDNNSALHLAIQKHHVGVVFWLIKEVPTLVNHENEDIKSPLYVAAEEGHAAIVKLILESCKEVPSVYGPKGATALHAAARKGSVDCIKHLLCLDPGLLKMEDKDKQWVPLDEAVSGGHVSATKELLDRDVNLGYLKRENWDNDISPIHIAARLDYCEILEYLISKCPGCVDITNETRWNILHVAIDSSSIKVITFIFQQKSLNGLINQKDNNGNTPIHLLLDKAFNTEKEKFCSLDIMKILKDRKVDCNAINNKSQKPIDMVASSAERVRLWEAISQKPPKWETNKAYDSGEARKQFDMIDQIVIVVALTLTTSFAAAFAVPGGYDGNQGSKQGMPILLHKFAYKVFVVANALAFICSGSVLIQHVKMLIGRYSKNGIYQDDLDRIVHRAFSMYGLTGMAMVAMVIAFISGTYVTLTPSLCFGISVCSICISIFVGILLLDVKLGALVHKFWNICMAITGG